MCGLSAIINRKGGSVSEDNLALMNRLSAHRGPDAAGTVVVAAVGLAHRRLSIIDMSASANQPMRRGASYLVFNGELYNYKPLRTELESLGCKFTTSSDTEVMLYALQTWWTEALPRLNGMFAIAYYDAAKRKTLLARDRFGKKPLVVMETPRNIYAASEAKQIIALPSAEPRVNLTVASAFLDRGALNEDGSTFFGGIHELPGGWLAIHDAASDKFTKRRWYDLSSRVGTTRVSYYEATERVRSLLVDSIALRHQANVPVGACLSGGVDSSSICAISASIVADPSAFTVFTSFHNSPQFDERQYSRAVSREYGFRNIEIEPDLTTLFNERTLEHLATIHDQPLSSGSHFNEFQIYRSAREHDIPVILSGQGADEYFGGYGSFWYSALLEDLQAFNMAGFKQGIDARASAMGVSRGVILRNFVKTFLAGRQPKRGLDIGLYHNRRSVSKPNVRQPHFSFRDLSLEQLGRTSLPYQLHSEDRNSMHFSVETRHPFLDFRLVEFVLSLPTSYKVGAGFQKRILRDAVGELPAAISLRTGKLGFVSPDEEYIFSHPRDIRDRVEAAAKNMPALLDAAKIVKAFDRMISGQMSYDPVFFRILSLQAWSRAFGVPLS